MNSKPTITPEALKLLAELINIEIQPSEIEQLCRTYEALERMKTLVRKPRHYSSELAHIFKPIERGVGQ
ncbi:hypothetical protein WA1_33880 [Scytonema hofmannii PCC 7110]|uniref:Uncharacterized protein n=1 Tax=Scytonema hofmannii PCC 7110 TaxID=128403 RepID=A0A139X2U8_9CYAN|nr:hypothetical protein [Scytonema hofmannii]KYC38986.1 hypothetical protein WA1_33880 [Scytonema hofmannii PCC 7110]